MTNSNYFNLRDLAKIVGKSLPARDQFISRSMLHDARNINSNLFRHLVNEPSLDEELVSNHIFQVKPSNGLYKTHKSQFKELLLNTIFVLDFEAGGYNLRTQRLNQNDRAVFLSSVLVRLGIRRMARQIGEKALSESLELEYWSNARRLASILRDDAAQAGEPKRREKFAKEYYRVAELEIATQRAMDNLTAIVSAFAVTGSEKRELKAFALAAVEEIERASQLGRTFRVVQLHFRLKAAYLQIEENYEETLLLCNEYEDILNRDFRSFADTAALGEVYLKRAVCYSQIRDFREGSLAVEKCTKLIPYGSNNWFNLQEHNFLLSTHCLSFGSAREVYDLTVNHQRFISLPDYLRERWDVFRHHLEFAESKVPKSTNLSGVLKHLPVYSKDKSGFRASLLVLQTLILIDRGDFKSVLGRMDALRKYRLRHLKGEGHNQSNLFFKVLSTLEKCSFDISLTIVKAASEIKQLRERSKKNLEGIQILPYTWMWDHIVESLTKRAITSGQRKT